MDPKRNERFFKQNDMLRLIGGGMLIVGLIWFWLGWSAASYYGPCVMVPAGLVLFLGTSARHVPESEIRGNIQKALADLARDVEENPEQSLRVLATPAPYRGESFVFDGSARLFRRGKDARLLSDVYEATALYFTQEALLLRGATVRLLDASTEMKAERLLWSELGQAVLVPYEARVGLTNQKNATATARGVWLELKGSAGQTLYRAAVPDDMDAESLCQQINKRAEQHARDGKMGEN